MDDDKKWLIFKDLMSDLLDEVQLSKDEEFKKFIRGKLRGIWNKKAKKCLNGLNYCFALNNIFIQI